MNTAGISQRIDARLWILARARTAVTAACLLAGCSESHFSSDPGLVWSAPAAIAYGTPLTSIQLNAAASVQGSFAYAPGSGTVLEVGSHTLSVTFTPAKPARYTTTTAIVTLTVNKASPAIAWNQPAAISYGIPLSETQLSAKSGNGDGAFAYTPAAGAVLGAGQQTLSTTFTPSDSIHYQVATATVVLTVMPAKPTLYWPAPAPVASGTALNSMQLDAISAGVAGTFTYSPPLGYQPPLGSQKLTATFTPSDAKNYDAVTASQILTVYDAAPPVITSQPQSQTVAPGQSATFSVTATGPSPLSYQWLKNSMPIAGATSASYTTPPARAPDNGVAFSVRVSDSAEDVVSSGAKLQVTVPVQSSYYVAINGNDQADGSALAPFATLQRAQSAMQTTSTKVTQIEGGTYYLATPLVLTAADQGETWEAAPGALAILSGGEVLTGWTHEGNGVYSSHTDQAVGLDLTISGIRQLPADRGFNLDEPYTSGWRVLAPNQTKGLSATFAIYPSDLTASVKPGALIQIVDHCRWTDLLTRILSVDDVNSRITVATKFDTGTSLGHAGSWRVINDPADLSAPGQFAYDPTSSMVYLMPASGVDPDSAGVVAAQLGTLIYLKDTSGITVSGVTFSDTTSDTVQIMGTWDDSHAAIMADGLKNSTISGNTFLNVGKGIVFSRSSDNAAISNTFEHLGASGINVSSDSNRNTLANNTLKDIGVINLGSYGVAINDSSNNLIDSNLIDGVGRWGIVFGPSGDPSDAAYLTTGNVFSNNVIRNTSNRTNDTGAIYGGAATVNTYYDENLVITGNRIENVGGLVRESSGRYDAGFAQGIYLDDHLSGVTVTNNVIESGSMYGVVLCHGCKSNTANNNVVILQPAPIYDRGTYGSSFAAGEMGYNGVTRIDLLPSYFPEDVTTTTIVVQVAGQAFSGTNAAFDVQVDGAVIGSGRARNTNADYMFKIALEPHHVHRVGIALTNGADTGTPTTALHNLGLMVNNTAVSLTAPEANGAFGSYGFAEIPDDLLVSNFSVVQNIVYRNGGLSQDVFDLTPANYPSYVDPDPGTIDSNLLYQNVSPATDEIFGTRPLDANSVMADPDFVNPSRGDYRMQPGSPALVTGFRPAGVPLTP